MDVYALAADMEAIDAHLDDDEQPAPPVDAEHANRLLRVLARTARERTDLVAQFDAEIAGLTARRDDLCSGLDRRAGHLETVLAGWHAATIADGGPKTLHLPAGDLTARASKGRVVIDDREALVSWALAHWPGIVTEVTEVRLIGVADIRAAGSETGDGRLVTPAGEPVPGVRVEGAGLSHTIRPAP